MWHKAECMGHPMRLKLNCVGLLVKLANRYITKGALWPTVVVPVRVLSIGQIEIFNHIQSLKPFNYMQINNIE